MERIGRGVRKRLRSRGCERELSGTADSSIAAERNADGAKCGRSFKADFVGCVGYQHIFAANLRAIECAGGGSATIVATLTPVPGSAPSEVLVWSLSGAGCSGASCGTLSVVTTQATGGNSMQAVATYTAPVSTPNPNIVTVAVTPQADPSKETQATVAIQAGVSVSVSPSTETRFEVVERSKGRLPGLVTIRSMGGRVGSLHSRIDGVPAFHAGEEAYLFLWGREGKHWRVELRSAGPDAI